MNNINKVLTATLVLACTLLAFDPSEVAKRSDKGYKGVVVDNWTAPNYSSIPNNMYGDYVKYGKTLIDETYKYIGPEVSDTKMRYAGNNLACSSCHEESGTKKWAGMFAGTMANFPQYSNREEWIGSIEQRINGCMERSMNGKVLPEDSKEMRAIVVYMSWLGQGMPIGATIKGSESPQIDRKIVMSRAADPKKGEEVYKNQCVQCHGENGGGIKREGKANGYEFPPLWGNDSYNKGAGMYRVIKAADWLAANMPFGADNENRVLTDDEAYDVAAYINDYDKPRAEKKNRDKDFLDLNVKAADSDIEPYNDGKNEKEHKFGPYKGIIIPKK
jgi:thiosulfate dehydrogenase